MEKNTFGAALCALLMVASTLPTKAQIKVTKVTTVEINTEAGDSVKYVEERHPGGFDFSLGFLQSRFSKKDSTKHINKESDWTLGLLGGVGVGFTTTLGAPAGMSTNMGSSIEVDWSNLVSIGCQFNRHHRLELGFGLIWRNWRMTDNQQFVQADDGQISLQPYAAGVNPKFSRLHSFMLTMPLTYTYEYKHWEFTAGPELCFKQPNEGYNSIKTRYTLNGEKMMDYTKNVHFNPVTVNLVAGVLYHDIGVYARYSPMDVLASGFGPSFGSLSVGIRLIGW